MSSGPAFFQTPMGHRFFESTMPQLVRELRCLNDNLERLVAVADRLVGMPQAPSSELGTPEKPKDSERP